MPEYPFKNLKRESESQPDYAIERVDGEDLPSIVEQLRLEMAQGYSSHEEDWPETTALERQQLIKDGKMILSVARDQGKIIAFIQMEMASGVLGREMKDDEVWVSALVSTDSRNQGVLGRMMAEHETIARDAGKRAIRSSIWNHNNPSMRSAMRSGFRLIAEGKYKDKDKTKPDCIYRKNIEIKPPIAERTASEIHEHLNAERKAGRLPVMDEVNSSSPNQLLIDPAKADLMNQALEHGYVGVYLLSPKDIEDDPEINKNYVVFVKAENLPENIS